MAFPDDRRPVDVSGRPLALRDVDLDGFLHPRTVAVIGASEAPRKANSAMTLRIKQWADAHGAEFHPVHPVHDQVLGTECVPSVADVPGDIDLAVILTAKAVDAFKEVLQRKAQFAVIFAAGFSEAGADGEELQRSLADLVASGGTHLLGPNTNLNAFSEFRDDLPGPSIALITQSGHQGRPVFQGQELGIAVSHWAPTGNEVDLEFADFARYFADQPEVGVIAAYVEGFKDGRTLMLAADHAARLRTPIVVVKVGRTDAGASMAQAHTGHLTGADTIVSAVFRQLGVIRVDGLDELLDTAAALARTRPATVPQWPETGPGVCIYAISGGTGAHLADLASAAGLRLPDLTTETQQALHGGLIPGYLRVSNPVDCGGPPVTTPAGRLILEAILADPNVDILICPITGALESMSLPLARDLVAVATTTPKPVFVVWGSPVGTEPAYVDVLLPSHLPVFRTFSNCVQAVRAYVDYWQFVARYDSGFDDAPTQPLPAATAALDLLAAGEAGGSLSEHRSKKVLEAYGIPHSRDVLVTSADDAVTAARHVGYPVVMKASSPALAHKSDVGLVRTAVGSDASVRDAFEGLTRNGVRVVGDDDRWEGVLVCETVSDGVEMVVGVSHDDLFGPVVMVGLGGVLIEVLDDVTFRVPPFPRSEAQRMLRELRGYPVLEGARGADRVDLDTLVDVIMRVQRLALDLADAVAAVDVNPLAVGRDRAVALDALVVTK